MNETDEPLIHALPSAPGRLVIADAAAARATTTAHQHVDGVGVRARNVDGRRVRDVEDLPRDASVRVVLLDHERSGRTIATRKALRGGNRATTTTTAVASGMLDGRAENRLSVLRT